MICRELDGECPFQHRCHHRCSIARASRPIDYEKVAKAVADGMVQVMRAAGAPLDRPGDSDACAAAARAYADAMRSIVDSDTF